MSRFVTARKAAPTASGASDGSSRVSIHTAPYASARPSVVPSPARTARASRPGDCGAAPCTAAPSR